MSGGWQARYTRAAWGVGRSKAICSSARLGTVQTTVVPAPIWNNSVV